MPARAFTVPLPGDTAMLTVTINDPDPSDDTPITVRFWHEDSETGVAAYGDWCEADDAAWLADAMEQAVQALPDHDDRLNGGQCQ